MVGATGSDQERTELLRVTRQKSTFGLHTPFFITHSYGGTAVEQLRCVCQPTCIQDWGEEGCWR